MAGDPFKKVQAGQRMQIPAAAYNAFIDAAVATKSGLVQGNPVSRTQQSGGILVRNDTGTDIEQRFAIVALGAPLIDPDDNLQGFQQRIAFAGVLPEDPIADQRFAILQEPLDEDRIGRAILNEATPVQVDFDDEDHQFATPADGETAHLVSASSGPYRVLWKPDGDGLLWCIVIAERGGGGGGGGRVVFPPTGGIPPATLNAGKTQLTPGSAECFEATFADGKWTKGSTTILVYNTVRRLTGFPNVGDNGNPLQVKQVDGVWVVDVEDCT
jgi:hypothetical protein